MLVTNTVWLQCNFTFMSVSPWIIFKITCTQNVSQMKLLDCVLFVKISSACSHIHLMSEILNALKVYSPSISIILVLLHSSGVMCYRHPKHLFIAKFQKLNFYTMVW